MLHLKAVLYEMTSRSRYAEFIKKGIFAFLRGVWCWGGGSVCFGGFCDTVGNRCHVRSPLNKVQNTRRGMQKAAMNPAASGPFGRRKDVRGRLSISSMSVVLEELLDEKYKKWKRYSLMYSEVTQ